MPVEPEAVSVAPWPQVAEELTTEGMGHWDCPYKGIAKRISNTLNDLKRSGKTWSNRSLIISAVRCSLFIVYEVIKIDLNQQSVRLVFKFKNL